MLILLIVCIKKNSLTLENEIVTKLFFYTIIIVFIFIYHYTFEQYTCGMYVHRIAYHILALRTKASVSRILVVLLL